MRIHVKNSIILLLFVLFTYHCQAQNPCVDSLNFISQAYKDGEWNSCKNASLNFIKYFQVLDARLFSSKAPEWQKYSSNCQNSIPKVYYYLVKSYLRLYDLDNAIHYYRESQVKELSIDLDSTDNRLMSSFGKLKKYSFSGYLASVSTNFKEYRILNEFKLGAVFGFGRNSFLELAFTKRTLHHRSDHRTGIFGKPLKNDPAVFPSYNFSFSGNDRFIDLAILKKFMLYKNNLNELYFSAGLYVNYYAGSHINGYEIRISTASGTDTISPAAYSKRYDRIDSSNIKMDLKRLYKERLNSGIFVSYGSITRMRKGYEIFAELRFTIARNLSYRYDDFKNYKVGVDYLAIVLGLTKRHNTIRVMNKPEP